jgi:hypothetical protein
MCAFERLEAISNLRNNLAKRVKVVYCSKFYRNFLSSFESERVYFCSNTLIFCHFHLNLKQNDNNLNIGIRKLENSLFKIKHVSKFWHLTGSKFWLVRPATSPKARLRLPQDFYTKFDETWIKQDLDYFRFKVNFLSTKENKIDTVILIIFLR